MSKDNSFIKGAAILGMAGIIVKILGAIYRIPIGNIIKAEGMGYYQTAYPFYVLLLTVSTAGFPVAIAKLVSERRAIGDFRGSFKVFKVALMGLFIGAMLTSLFVLFFAYPIVEHLGNKNAYYALVALVPALFFVPIMSAFRGLFQGRQDMIPTALSQIMEQLFRVFTGLVLTYILLDKGLPIAAGGASFGGSIGAVVGVLTMYIIYISKKKEFNIEIKNSIYKEDYSTNKIIKDLLIIAIPITIGAAIAPIMDAIDAGLVPRRLQAINYSEAQANEMFGQLKGFAQTLINLPQVFSIAIGMSLVPAISHANAKKKSEDVKKLISSGIRMTLLIGLPSAFGLFVLSKPIIGLLYFNNTVETIASTGEILRYLSFGVIFLTLVQALTAILQGLDKPMIPVINLFIGAIAKIVLSYSLTGLPFINIKGAAISTVVAYAIAASLDIIALIVIFKFKFKYKEIFVKPLFSSICMAVIVSVSFNFLQGVVGDKVSTLLSILVGGISYVVLLLITGTITNEDIELISKNKKIQKIIDKLK